MCPNTCVKMEGKGPARPVSIPKIRMMIHDNREPYAISDDEIQMAIEDALLSAKSQIDVCIDGATGYPATDVDEYIVRLFAVVSLLENYMIQIRGGSNASGGSGQCGSAAYVSFIDSISEAGSSISFLSFGDIQSILESKRNELEKLKLSRWGCAIRVSSGNY